MNEHIQKYTKLQVGSKN